MKTINILFAGVGGQGIVSASDILADMALSKGYDVKKSEIHGMSQRGGTVSSFVRYGDRIFSSIPPKNEIDYIAAFEEMESLRWPDYINPGTKIIVNMKRIKPATLSGVKDGYPDAKGGLSGYKAFFIDASGEAKKIGNEKVESGIMLGALCGFLGFGAGEFGEAIKKKFSKYIDENITAFRRGEELLK